MHTVVTCRTGWGRQIELDYVPHAVGHVAQEQHGQYRGQGGTVHLSAALFATVGCSLFLLNHFCRV